MSLKETGKQTQHYSSPSIEKLHFLLLLQGLFQLSFSEARGSSYKMGIGKVGIPNQMCIIELSKWMAFFWKGTTCA